MSALVIKEWKAGPKAVDGQNNFVRIAGREGGLLSWLLSLMGIDPSTTILVGLDRVEFTSASLAGTESRLIPLEGVCSTYYGYYKPWKSAAAIIAFFMFLGMSMGSGAYSQGGAFFAFLFTTLVGVAIALVYYFLNRKLTLGFVETSGVINGIRFKRSVIENVDINQDQAKMVCVIVQRLIEAKQKRGLPPRA